MKFYILRQEHGASGRNATLAANEYDYETWRTFMRAGKGHRQNVSGEIHTGEHIYRIQLAPKLTTISLQHYKPNTIQSLPWVAASGRRGGKTFAQSVIAAGAGMIPAGAIITGVQASVSPPQLADRPTWSLAINSTPDRVDLKSSFGSKKREVFVFNQSVINRRGGQSKRQNGK